MFKLSLPPPEYYFRPSGGSIKLERNIIIDQKRMTEPLQKFELPGRVRVVAGPASLPKIQVTSRFSTAEVYPHGAHVTQFQKTASRPCCS